VVDLFVPGIPVSQGSERFFSNNGKVGMALSSKLKHWRSYVAAEAEKQMVGKEMLEGPLEAILTFTFERPAYHRPNKHYPLYHYIKPDLDKLQRAVFDALTGVVYKDDCQVSSIHANKCYITDYSREAGLHISVFSIGDGVEDVTTWSLNTTNGATSSSVAWG
jgi:crossover junction endodeoxyribonuclease RusA